MYMLSTAMLPNGLSEDNTCSGGVGNNTKHNNMCIICKSGFYCNANDNCKRNRQAIDSPWKSLRNYLLQQGSVSDTNIKICCFM